MASTSYDVLLHKKFKIYIFGRSKEIPCCKISDYPPTKSAQFDMNKAGHSIQCITHTGHSTAFLHFVTL